MTARDVFCLARSRWVTLTPGAGGRVTLDGPAAAVDELAPLVAGVKADLVELLADIEERAGILEFDGGATRGRAYWLALSEVMGYSTGR